MMIRINKPGFTLAALLAVCSLYLPQRANAQSPEHPLPLEIYPNPGHYSVMVTLQTHVFTPRNLSLKVYNKAGKLVSVNEKKLTPPYTWALFLDQLPAGEYKVVIIFDSLWATGSFVKVN
jgi:hypothetical protein